MPGVPSVWALPLVMFASAIGVGSALAEGPRSAIPWLTESVRTAPPELPKPAEGETEISVAVLDGVNRDGLGLLTPAQTGFPEDVWGGTSALRARALILNHRADGVPAAQALFKQLLLARTDAPASSAGRPLLLLARIDRLIQIGDLDNAEALIDEAGPTDPALFRRGFDIGLLTGHQDEYCSMLGDSPSLSPTLPARVYCLARLGDWKAAALTLKLGHDIGEIGADQEELLARFLDPQLFEGTEAPPPSDPMTPLELSIREAVALPRGAGTVPNAFLHLDLPEHAPIRSRMLAAERLVRSGAIPEAPLFAAYRAGRPAASGGVWDRAAAVQRLDTALATGKVAAVAAELEVADRLFSANGLRDAFAHAYRQALKALPRDGFPDEDIGLVHTLLLLAADPGAAQRWQRTSPTPSERLLQALAEGSGPLPGTTTFGEVERAVITGLTAIDPPTVEAEQLASLFGSRFGEALIGALGLLDTGLSTDPGDLEAALYALRQGGLERQARRVALEMLLLQDEA